MSKFKAGDFVYYPARGTQVFRLEDCGIFENYPICIYFDDNNYKLEKFTSKGRAYIDYKLPQLFHATPENHELLEKLYGVEFEKPPAPPTSKEIIQAMLERGDKYVACWVSDKVTAPTSRNISVFVHYIEYGEIEYFIDCDAEQWLYATPFDPRTGEPITELPE